MKEKPQKKDKLLLPYKEIRIQGQAVGKLYLIGTSRWDDEQDQATVILSIVSWRGADICMAIIAQDGFFFASGGMVIDISGVYTMTVGTLRQLIPKDGDKMGFLANIADRMGAALDNFRP